MLAQIGREPFKRSGNGVKDAFDIIINNLDEPVPAKRNLWTAPYLVDLNDKFDNSPDRWGWISGDRSGYTSAYMFLVDRDSGRVVARVLFGQVPGAGYIQVNDQYMDEIQTTGIGYDGTCANGSVSDPKSQAQSPGIQEDYQIDDTTEVRPLIPMFVDGVRVEDRSYTNTVTPGSDVFRFVDLGKTTVPFTAFNGVGGTPHTVYERHRVGGLVNVNGVWGLAVVVYYDILDPSASFGN